MFNISNIPQPTRQTTEQTSEKTTDETIQKIDKKFPYIGKDKDTLGPIGKFLTAVKPKEDDSDKYKKTYSNALNSLNTLNEPKLSMGSIGEQKWNDIVRILLELELECDTKDQSLQHLSKFVESIKAAD